MVRWAILAMIFGLGLTSCAHYQWGRGERVFPGGYDRVAIPTFRNSTEEVGAETYFTDSLRMEFERSSMAHVTAKSNAQVIIEGDVKKITITPTLPITNAAPELTTPNPVPNPIAPPGTPVNPNPLPNGTVLSKQYIVTVEVHVQARKVSDNSILWQSDFSGTNTYLGPLLGTPGVNASVPLYNESSRKLTMQALARNMMAEAHDRMTENF